MAGAAGVIHKRFNMSQAGFIERWCLNNVLAEVSSGADGSAVVRFKKKELRAAVCCSATACAGDEALVGTQVESLSHLCIALWCGRLLLGCAACGPCLWLVGYLRWMSGYVLLAGDHTVWDPGGGEAGAELWTHLRLLFFFFNRAFCSAVRCGTNAAAEWPMCMCSLLLLSVVALTSSWLRRAIRLHWLLTLQGRRRHCLLGHWCVIHKRFDMSQAEFIQRWCLTNNVLAEVSSDADG